MRNLKKILALVLALMMTLSLMVTASASSYSDAGKIDAAYNEAVEVLTGMGVYRGNDKGEFLPDTTLNRKDAAALIYRIISGDVGDKYLKNYKGYADEQFTDVSADDWFEPYVAYCVNGGYIKGDGNGHFNPDASITGTEVLTILLRAVGYDQHGEFSKDWPLTVATLAKELGVTNTVTGVSLTKAVSREVVAELIFKTLTEAYTVKYTPAFGYQPIYAPVTDNEGNSTLTYMTLGTKIFGLTRTREYTMDVWGRPAYSWTYTTGNTETVFPYEPVQTYTTAKTDCEIAVDLGLKRSTTVNIFVDGGNRTGLSASDAATTATYTPSLNPLTTTYAASVNGTGTGVLTEVYKLANGSYRLVEINTYFAEVTGVTNQVTDPAGHVHTPASITMSVYSSASPWAGRTFAATGYSVGDFVKVTMLSDGNVKSVEKAVPVATGAVNHFVVGTLPVNGTVTVAGKPYSENVKFFYGKEPTVGNTYDVYTDANGNVLALAVPATLYSYGILDSGIHVTNGFNPYYAGKLVTVADGKVSANEVKVASATNHGSDMLNWADNAISYLHCIVSYTVNADGTYSLATAADTWTTGGSVVKGTPRILDNGGNVIAVTDAETVYVVETAEGTYATYTGFANVPSIATAQKIEVKNGANGYADLVYINAIGAVYAGSTTYAYVMPATADTGDGSINGVAYDVYSNVVINGQVQSVNVSKAFSSTFATLGGQGVYLVYDVNGLVCYAMAVAYTASNATVTSNSGSVVYFGDAPKGYVVDTNTVIWKIDTANVRAAVGAASDLTVGKNAVYEVASDGVTLLKVIIWDTIQW